ncbi:tripartite tricarboxylate transporter substrate binding protein [Bradyrhizobium sp. JYMT SZCCT0428]|uniref:Bug family tripartite tricarboxylate transporter substrate binding protein n=1 Tax=Bradyrhizobium sp. JYMT SZCCT0428 TaxID=2807673 RepID=UPI001BABAA5A|nr:tripartite tricarboxylate transporter substrate binding protein [Bradyrhizobium sp. JYMT SZCCT0428]MBR1155654.1 tripartite tricarboxylate transporter substrate binding protein [Bradyrhizobium sp. JYMT SZCCT0428]
MRQCLVLLVAAGAAVCSVAAEAQSYPARSITMVVPYAAGGVFDTIARIIGARMGELLGQSVVVENVTGAGGIIGVQRVIHAKPDGYTVLLGTVGTHAYNQSIYRKHRYDAVSDFTPVTLFSDQPMVLEGRKDLPANNLTEFIALLKQNGTKMQYGSAGVGSTTHLACALLNARIGVEVTHVPYRGGGPVANDLIGGRIDYMCGNMGSSVLRVAAKQSKPLALLSRERTPLMPELATAQEQGIDDYDVVTWTAFFLPKGAPKDIVVKLNEATSAAMDTPAIRARFNDIGVVGVAPQRRGPEYLAKYVVEEIARWERPIKDAGLQAD